MNLFLPSVCIGLVVLITIFSDGLVIGLCKLLTAALVIAGIHLVGRLSHRVE